MLKLGERLGKAVMAKTIKAKKARIAELEAEVAMLEAIRPSSLFVTNYWGTRSLVVGVYYRGRCDGFPRGELFQMDHDVFNGMAKRRNIELPEKY